MFFFLLSCKKVPDLVEDPPDTASLYRLMSNNLKPQLGNTFFFNKFVIVKRSDPDLPHVIFTVQIKNNLPNDIFD